jgi:hypothetical protein
VSKIMFRRFGKPIMSVIVAAALVLYAQLADTSPGGTGIVDVEWVLIGIGATQALQTYVIPLAGDYPWSKTAAAATLAGLQVLVTVIVGGLDTQEWLLIGFAVAGALGVAVAPAVSDNGVRARAGLGDAGRSNVALVIALGVCAALGLFVLTEHSADASTKPRPGTCDVPAWESTPTVAPSSQAPKPRPTPVR